MSDFPTKQNPQNCKNGCGTRIYLSDQKQKGKWLPYELDDVVHDCPNYQKPEPDKLNAATTTGQEPTKQDDNKAVIKTAIARLDGIKADLENLLNQK